jgi:hypothetical protein
MRGSGTHDSPPVNRMYKILSPPSAARSLLCFFVLLSAISIPELAEAHDSPTRTGSPPPIENALTDKGDFHAMSALIPASGCLDLTVGHACSRHRYTASMFYTSREAQPVEDIQPGTDRSPGNHRRCHQDLHEAE